MPLPALLVDGFQDIFISVDCANKNTAKGSRYGILACATEKNHGERRFVIEDGSIPGAIASLMPTAFAAAAALQHEESDMPSALSRGAYGGPIDRSLTYLVMSHDDAAGCRSRSCSSRNSRSYSASGISGASCS